MKVDWGHYNLAWVPRKFHTVLVSQLATEILNISCAKSVAGPEEFFVGGLKLYFRKPSWQLQQKCKVLSLVFAQGRLNSTI
jgi:hypothetical protein